MQTFLPYPEFYKVASVLDRQRLGKQRVEAKLILEILLGRKSSWSRHPAVKMWIGYERALAIYGDQICLEWARRGYVDNLKPFFYRIKIWLGHDDPVAWPRWLGDEKLHSSHRAALLKKNPAWYGKFEWKESPVIDYYWPKGATC